MKYGSKPIDTGLYLIDEQFWAGRPTRALLIFRYRPVSLRYTSYIIKGDTRWYTLMSLPPQINNVIWGRKNEIQGNGKQLRKIIPIFPQLVKWPKAAGYYLGLYCRHATNIWKLQLCDIIGILVTLQGYVKLALSIIALAGTANLDLGLGCTMSWIVEFASTMGVSIIWV
jgi:hypothetical protein